MRNGLTVIAVVCALFCAPLAHAQDTQETLGAKLLADAIGDVKPGTYLAGDQLQFTLDRYGARYLLRVKGDPEVYVLYANRASLGGRLLKYDNGTTAMSIAGWGGVTFYTDAKPQGLPAARTGNSTAPTLNGITNNDMQNAVSDETQHLTYAHKLKIAVIADPGELGNTARDRALAFDVMENTVRGIDRFSANAKARAALLAKIDTVKIVLSSRPTANLSGKTLIVTYNRTQGYGGRASSRGIARALGLLLGIKQTN